MLVTSVGIPIFSTYQNYSSFIKYQINVGEQSEIDRFEIQLQFKRDSNKNLKELLIFWGTAKQGMQIVFNVF